LFAALGTAAIVAAAVIGWVSFNALSGLPFHATYSVNVATANADRLIADDDVRIAGVRVGRVSTVTAEPARRGTPPYALVGLSLDPSVGHLPIDTTVKVRPASVLGATYVELTLGHSRRTVAAGGTLPLSRATGTVDITDLFQIFNGNAARDFRNATSGLAAGFAGRGQALNSTIGSLAVLFPALTKVASALASPQAGIPRFVDALASTSTILASRSSQLAGFVSAAAATFEAFVDQRRAVAATIDIAPSAETAATTALQDIQPGLDRLSRLMTQLQPVARLLPSGVANVNSTLSAGLTPLQQLPTLTRPLQTTLSALTTVTRLPSTNGAIRKLTDLMGTMDQSLRVLVPAQVHCNVIPLFFEAVASYEGVLGTDQGPALGNGSFASGGVPGEQVQSAKLTPGVHINNEPTENGTMCAANNEPFTSGQTVVGNPTGRVPDSTRPTYPPPGVLQRARAAGLLAPPNPPQ
jgi:phospholipid/cholesterol/gamma-HCH transport system substrate-binding protein